MSDGKLEILLAEDDEGNRAFIGDLLETKGHSVTAFANGNSALEVYKLNPTKYDLVITDLEMPPGTDGERLARSIRELNSDQKIILLTATPSYQCPPKLFDARVEKPIRIREVPEWVSAVMDGKSTPEHMQTFVYKLE